MEYYHGLFGTDFMTALHNGDCERTLAGLQDALNGEDRSSRRRSSCNWSTMVAVDGLIDDGARILGPYNEKLFTAPTLDASIKWDNPHAYDTPGAPSNGSDYVALRNAGGTFLNGGQVDSLSFQGRRRIRRGRCSGAWRPTRPSRRATPRCSSRAANNRDEAIVRSITVPSGAGASLTFDALWNRGARLGLPRPDLDRRGRRTRASLARTQRPSRNPDALPTAKENVPGFTGYPGAWRPQACSLSAYAGQTVLLAFRTFNDGSLGESTAVPPGAWVDDVRVGGTLISDGSEPSRMAVLHPGAPGHCDRLHGHDPQRRDRQGQDHHQALPLIGTFAVQGKANVQKYIEKNADFVAAIVFYDDPSETSTDYARYRLTVNGVTQPGGGM